MFASFLNTDNIFLSSTSIESVKFVLLATLSSLTEILIPLTRVKASTYAKGMASTIKNVTSKIGDDTLRELQDRHGLSKEEAMREMHRVF